MDIPNREVNMGVTGVGGYSLDSYQMQQLFAQDGKNVSQTTAKTASSYSAVQTVSAVAELTRAVMEKMGVGKNDRVTFSQINAYRQQLEQEYAEKLNADFEKLGIDPKVTFQLKVNDAGGLSVSSAHADKDKLQKYFDDNPELVKKYQEIQALADLDAARKKLDINPAELRKRIQIESMSTWWGEQGNASSIMNMGSAGVNWFSGVQTTV